MSQHKLTPEIEQQIVSSIRTGGYPYIAAEAAGIPRAVFEKWLRRGEKSRQSVFHDFWLKVCQAHAQARVLAEITARGKDAKFWLHYGPGKETLDSPGWSASAKPVPREPEVHRAFDDPRFRKFVANLIEALTPFPEAHQAVIDRLGPDLADLGKA